MLYYEKHESKQKELKRKYLFTSTLKQPKKQEDDF